MSPPSYMRGLLWVVPALFVLGLVVRSAEAEPDLPPATEAQIHLRVLSFDRAAAKRGKAVIAVVSKSETERTAMVQALTSLAARQTIGGNKITVVGVAFDPNTIRKSLIDLGATAVYVTPSVHDSIDVIGKAAAELKLATLAGRRKAVTDGIAVGVIPVSGRPKILINLKKVKEVGMNLDPKIVALAEVIK